MTCGGWSRRSSCPAARCASSRRTWGGRSATTSCWCRWPRVCSTRSGASSFRRSWPGSPWPCRRYRWSPIACGSADSARARGERSDDDGQGPGLPDARGSEERGRAVEVSGADLLLLRGRLQGEVRRRSPQVPRPMIGSPFLAGRDRYERVMDGRVDNTHDTALTHTVRLTDPDRCVEVTAVYSPAPGALGIFTRKKVARLVVTGPRLHLFRSMHDNVHGFDVHYEIDVDRGTIVAADSITSRLPYAGICSEPQSRIESLRGQAVDVALRKRIQGLLGGLAGCAQLYDLTSDLLKLLSLDPST